MKKIRRVRHAHILTWLMAAVLTVTTITPSFTSFAAEECETATDPTDNEDKSDGSEDSGQDPAEDAREDSEDDPGEDGGKDAEEDTKEDKKEDTAATDADEDTDDPVNDDESGESEDVDKSEDIENIRESGETEDDVPEKDNLTDKLTEKKNVIKEDKATEAACMYDGEYYETIQEVLNIIKDGEGTVTLMDDVKLSGVIEITEGTIVLDLGGYTLSGEIYVENGSSLTVKNGTIDSGDKYWKVHASGDDDRPTVFTLAEDADISANIYGLLICGKGGASGNNGAGFVVTIDGTIEVGDGKAETTGGGIWLQGNMKNETAKVCHVIINGSVINADADGPGIAVNGWGNVIINEEAKVSGATGVEIRAGSLTVNGGTITGKADAFTSRPNSDGSSTSGAGIAVNEHTTKLPITVVINDGEITGHYALAQTNTQSVANEIDLTVAGGTFVGYNNDCAILLSEYEAFKDHFSISGGMFVDSEGNKSDVSTYFAEGYTQDENGNVAAGEPDSPTGGDDDEVNTDNGNGSSGSSGGHSGGHSGKGSGSGKPAGVSHDSSYIGANGMKGNWYLSGNRFTKADGTHPSREYLKIDGKVYAFNASGYAVPFTDSLYFDEVIAAAGDIPETEGTWDLCGWWFIYSDGTYPHNDWAQLIHGGRSDWYYFDPEGWMLTGWNNIGGFWYYLGDDGAMLYDAQTPDGHTVDSSGRAVR